VRRYFQLKGVGDNVRAAALVWNGASGQERGRGPEMRGLTDLHVYEDGTHGKSVASAPDEARWFADMYEVTVEYTTHRVDVTGGEPGRQTRFVRLVRQKAQDPWEIYDYGTGP